MNLLRKIFNSRPKKDGNFFSKLKKLLGFNPVDLSIYEEAFTHRSANIMNEEGDYVNYERLEFLGDAMLGSFIAAHLFKTVPNGNEGYLTQMRSKIVSREYLNELGKELKLVDFLNSNISNQFFSENIHGNLFEALIGAIYLDKGYLYCERFIKEKVIDPHVNIKRLEGKITSYKSLLIEWCQKNKKNIQFEVYEDDGNDQIKHFAVKLFIDKKLITKARGKAKKKAEEKASKRAYFVLQDKIVT